MSINRRMGKEQSYIVFYYSAMRVDKLLLPPTMCQNLVMLDCTDIRFKNSQNLGERERWRRNRTARPLSPSQIPQKNISTPSKLHKTTYVGWQRTSGNQKSRSLSSKTGRKKYKRRKGDKGGKDSMEKRQSL